MFTETLSAIFFALFLNMGTPVDGGQIPPPQDDTLMQRTELCSAMGEGFIAAYEMHANGTEKEVVTKAMLDVVYDAMPPPLGWSAAFVMERSINSLYSVAQVPDKVSWFYMTQLYCVNALGTDFLPDTRVDFLGKPKQRIAGVQ